MELHRRVLIITIFLFIFITEACLSQDTLWTKRYGGQGSQVGLDLKLTDDDGFILVGRTDSGYPGWDAYVVIVDGHGEPVSNTIFGGEDYQSLISVCRSENGYASVGTSNHNAWFVSIGDEGDSLWSMVYGGVEYDAANSITATNDGGYIISGNTESFGAGDLDWYVIKTDADGDTQWTRTYGWSGFDLCYSTQPTKDGGYVIAGYSVLNDITRACVIKTDAQGNPEWYNLEQGDYTKVFFSAVPTLDGGYIAAGYTYIWDLYWHDELYMVKYDAVGDKEWERQHENPPFFSCVAADVQQTLDGGYITVGSTSYMTGDAAGFVLKTNSLGDKQWSKTFYIQGIDQYFSRIGRISYSEYAAVGTSYEDMWLVKLWEPLVCCGVLMIPDDDPVTVQPGGSFRYRGIVSNSHTEPLPTDVWTGVIYEGEFFLLHRFPRIESLQPGEVIMRRLVQNVPYYAPSGDYQYVSYCGIYPEACDSFKFDFTVTGDGRLAGIDGEVIARSPKGDEAIPDPLHDNGNRLLRFAFAASRCDRGNDGIDGFILPPASGWTVEEITPSGGQPSRADTKSVDAGAPTGGVDASPNPFNAITTITYQLPEAGNVNLSVYNLSGQRIATLVDGVKSAGEHTITWDASEYSSGIYFYRLVAGDEVFTKRMTLLK